MMDVRMARYLTANNKTKGYIDTLIKAIHKGIEDGKYEVEVIIPDAQMPHIDDIEGVIMDCGFATSFSFTKPYKRKIIWDRKFIADLKDDLKKDREKNEKQVTTKG